MKRIRIRCGLVVSDTFVQIYLHLILSAFRSRHPLHIGSISGKPIQCIRNGFNGHGMAVILFAAKEIKETVKE